MTITKAGPSPVLHSINLTVRSVPASLDFYRALFSLHGRGQTPDGKHAMFLLANVMVELHERGGPAPPQQGTPSASGGGGGGVNLSLAVEDVAPLRRALREAGWAWEEREYGGGSGGEGAAGEVLAFADPDGYAWEVVGAGEEGSAEGDGFPGEAACGSK
ncbi:hypothetical protein NKR23_g8318 [Pleurostoma richardsiae]|uniref:VOC domain-containing protein n=1 Tax=Pleurostoma richardsiae TaxID=41990 RepID=A0AA38RKC7_9PEZI|nr:hypothetical protein NKR23_g8318 [Pleurostoma richardsiae]